MGGSSSTAAEEPPDYLSVRPPESQQLKGDDHAPIHSLLLLELAALDFRKHHDFVQVLYFVFTFAKHLHRELTILLCFRPMQQLNLDVLPRVPRRLRYHFHLLHGKIQLESSP